MPAKNDTSIIYKNKDSPGTRSASRKAQSWQNNLHLPLHRKKYPPQQLDDEMQLKYQTSIPYITN